MSEEVKTVVLTCFVLYSVVVGGVVGVTLFADPISSDSMFISESVNVEEISESVVSSDDVVAYEELTTEEQELFRGSFASGSTIDSSSDLVGSVVSLDGSYYNLSSTFHASTVSLFLFLVVFFVSFSLPILLFSMIEKESLKAYFTALNVATFCVIISAVYIISVSGVVPMYDVVYAEVSSDPVSVEVDSASVVDIEDVDQFYRSLLYEHITGGSAVSMEEVEYRSLGTSPDSYIFTTYEYVSSDGELYHLQEVEKGNYGTGLGGLILSYLASVSLLGIIYRNRD